MNHTIKKRDSKIYALHVEMRADKDSIAAKTTSVWLASLTDGETTVYDNNISDLLDRLFELVKTQNICVYTYDLKYEWNAIIPELMRRDFKYASRLETRTYNDTAADQQRSIIYCATIQPGFLNKTITFRDLKRMFPLSLEEIAAAFDINIDLNKIDNSIKRGNDYVATEEEKQYCKDYTDSIFGILKEIDKMDDSMFWSSYTIAGYSIKKIIDKSFKPSAANSYSSRKGFRMMYPRYELEKDKKELDALFHSYEGALTFALPDVQFKDINAQILHIDAHQMYPTQVCKHVFPCGKGTYFEGAAPKGKMNLLHIKAAYDGVILNARPSLIGLDFGEDIDLWA